MREMESGQSTNKADILYRFLEDPKSKLVFKEKIMKIAAVPEKHLMDPPKDDTQPSSGKLIRINKRNIRALAGSKYDRESKFSQLSKAKLRAALPPETTCDDGTRNKCNWLVRPKNQVVYTIMLLAFWGRLRLSEILCSSAINFKPLNAFLRNDLLFIDVDGKGTEGLQLWIRHA